MRTVIEATGLTKSYGNVKAVDDVSLKVLEGEVFGLVGPNGAGKTTIVKLLTGQVKPDDGTIKVLGTDVVKNPVKAREDVGIIPEQEVPPSFLNSEEYLDFVSEIRGLKNVEKGIEHWFKFLDYENETGKLSKDLSRGTRQKLMISQAFFFNPRLAFIDEPLVNLDPRIQKKVRGFLKDYVKKGNTIFLCTHVLAMAEEVCSRVAFMNKGRIIRVESVEQLVKKYKSLENAFLRIEK